MSGVGEYNGKNGLTDLARKLRFSPDASKYPERRGPSGEAGKSVERITDT